MENKKTKLKPLPGRIIIIPELEDSKTKSGIFLSREDKPVPVKGEVYAVGDYVEDVKAGDKVLFRKFSPEEVELDGQKYLFVEESDLVAVL